MMPNKVKAKTENINLINKTNRRISYKEKVVEEVTDYVDYNEEKSGFNLDDFQRLINPNHSQTNSKLVEENNVFRLPDIDDLVKNLDGLKNWIIGDEIENQINNALDNTIAKLPFKVELNEDDKKYIFEKIMNNPEKFYALSQKDNISMSDAITIIKLLNMPYERLSRIIPDLNSIINTTINENLPFEVKLADEDIEEIYNIIITKDDKEIKEFASLFDSLLNSDKTSDKLEIVFKIIKKLEDFNVDMSYKRISRMVPGLSSIINNALNENLPFEVKLSDEDIEEIYNVIITKDSKKIKKFLSLCDSLTTKSDPMDLLRAATDIIKMLKDFDIDISYNRISKIVPDINNIIKSYLVEFHVSDIVTIDYNNIGVLWDAILSNDSSKIDAAIDKCIPKCDEEITAFIKRWTNVVVDSKEIDVTKAISIFASDIPGNLDRLEKIFELCGSKDILDKLNGVKEIIMFGSSLGINIGDAAHMLHDTLAEVVTSDGVKNHIRNIPLIGNGIIDLGQTVSNGYNFVAENSKSIPFVGGGINYLMTTDIVDKVEDAYETGAKVVDNVYNFGCDTCEFIGDKIDEGKEKLGEFIDFVTFWD